MENNPNFKNNLGLTRFLHSFFNEPLNHVWAGDFEQSRLPINFSETSTGFQIEVAAPGFEKNDFGIRIENDCLNLSGHVRENSKKGEGKWLRKEFSFKNFEKKWSIPKNVNKEMISAVYEEGILKVILPYKNSVLTAKNIEIS